MWRKVDNNYSFVRLENKRQHGRNLLGRGLSREPHDACGAPVGFENQKRLMGLVVVKKDAREAAGSVLGSESGCGWGVEQGF